MNAPDPFVPPSLFPPDFTWGVATAAFQIEGGAANDGRGRSVWDAFCEQPGVIADASNGLRACDHYHRWAEDLDLAASLGINAYRFSVAWPRVQPLGQGAWNPQGLDFYDRLVDGALARGMKPWLTLNHWDLPAALQAQGGWAARDTVARFVEYAQGIHARLGDRLHAITTHNEPWVVATLGHETGIFAPGLRSRALAAQVSHHLLLSHGQALQALRAEGSRAQLGIVLNLSPMHPASASPADQAAARLEDGKLLRWYCDPLFHGHYPEDVWSHLGADAPQVLPGDLATIAQPMDYLGINYYTRAVASADPASSWDPKAQGLPITDMGWEIYPQGLTELLLRLQADYPVPPMVITENGAAFADIADAQGQVHDADRATYIARHIAAVGQAMAQGARVSGYMVWSLLDNFEWASGYAKRFGIVRVDYDSQQRTLKDSGLWYRGFLAEMAAAATTSALNGPT